MHRSVADSLLLALVLLLSFASSFASSVSSSLTLQIYDPELLDVSVGVSGANTSFLFAGYRAFLLAQYVSVGGTFRPISHFAFQPPGHCIHSAVVAVLPCQKQQPEAEQHVVAVASGDLGFGASSSEVYWLRYDARARLPRLVCSGPVFASLLSSDFQILSLDDPLKRRVVVLDQHNATLYFVSEPTPASAEIQAKPKADAATAANASAVHASARSCSTSQADHGTICPWLAVSLMRELLPTSMAIDSIRQLVYVSCKGDHVIRILDVHSGRLVGHFDWNGVGNGQLAIDSARRLLYIHYPYFRDTPLQNASNVAASDFGMSETVENIHVLDLSRLELPTADAEAPCTLQDRFLRSIYFAKRDERIVKMALDSATGVLHLLSYYTSEPGVYLWTSYAPCPAAHEHRTGSGSLMEPCRVVYVGDVVARGMVVDPLTSGVIFYGRHRATNTSTMFQFSFSLQHDCLANVLANQERPRLDLAAQEKKCQNATMQKTIRALALDFEKREAADQSAASPSPSTGQHGQLDL